MNPMDECYLRLLVERHSLREISRMFGLGLSTVRYWVHKHDIKMPENPFPDWDLGKFSEAVKDNITVAGVLREIGESPTPVNYRRVHRLVEDLGLYTDHWRGKAHGTSRPRRQDGKAPASSTGIGGSSPPGGTETT